MNNASHPAAVAFVPGMPHLLRPNLNPHYHELAAAMTKLGDRLAQRGVERILYFSSQWLSVLGYSVQARLELSGLHVDENWHDLIDLPFRFCIDRSFADRLSRALNSCGYQARLVDYDHFPVDTGTIVADQLINRGRFSTAMLSCWLYADCAGTEAAAQSVATVLRDDPTPTAVVAISALSGGYFTTEIDLREDQLSSFEHDSCNLKLLHLLESGNSEQFDKFSVDYERCAKGALALRVLSFLRGFGILNGSRYAQTLAYGAIYGTGAAVIDFVPGVGN